MMSNHYTKSANVEMESFLLRLWDLYSHKINHKIVQVKDELDNTVYTFSCQDGRFRLMCKYSEEKPINKDESKKEYNFSCVDVNVLISVMKESSFKFVLDVNLNGETFMDIIDRALGGE